MSLSRQPMPQMSDPVVDLPGADLAHPLLQHQALMGNQGMLDLLSRTQDQSLVAASERPNQCCVRAPSFGLSLADGIDAEDPSVKGVADLYRSYRTWGKAVKQGGRAGYDGHEDDLDAQTDYSRALKWGERRPDSFEALLAEVGFGLDGGRIVDGDRHVANLLTGDDAYEQTEAPNADNGLVNPVYSKRLLPGLQSDKQYVKLHDAFLRRQATRGITPPERRAYVEGRDLQPVYSSDLAREQGKTGVHYFDDGGSKIRDRDANGLPKRSDLQFLKDAGGKNALSSVPRSSLPFLQERLGVNKVLSGTSVDATAIQSNHGGGFGRFGSVDIDLAKVPQDAVMHTYKEAMRHGLPPAMVHNKDRLEDEEQRAEETALRNRELHFDHLPREAVTLNESASRLDYEGAFDEGYQSTYHLGFKDQWRETKGRDHRGRVAVPDLGSTTDLNPESFTGARGWRDGKSYGRQSGRDAVV